MKKIIYKYEINQNGRTELEGPFIKPLDIQFQGDKAVVWIELKDMRLWELHPEEMRKYVFTAIGTGWPYTDDVKGEYFKTVQDACGFVWHVFFQEVE
jgi:hypothetical protein